MLRRWWKEAIRPRLDAEVLSVLDEVFRYDLLTQPISHLDDTENNGDLPVIEAHNELWYVRENVTVAFDVLGVHAALSRGEKPEICPDLHTISLYYRVGFDTTANLTYYGQIDFYRGRTEFEIKGIERARSLSAG